jgi:hypothetical protein
MLNANMATARNSTLYEETNGNQPLLYASLFKQWQCPPTMRRVLKWAVLSYWARSDGGGVLEALICIKEERNEVIWREGGISNCSTDTANRLTTDMSATISIPLCQRSTRLMCNRTMYGAQRQNLFLVSDRNDCEVYPAFSYSFMKFIIFRNGWTPKEMIQDLALYCIL